MPTPIKIDFVSDVSCPWCVIGLGSLETAIDRVGDLVDVDIHFQPFELNPQMAPEGENIVEHIGRKYGSSPEQSAATRAMIRDRAAETGFEMRMGDDSRIYNTFDAHRLLHWAETEGEGKQRALKEALFAAYFTLGDDPSSHQVLLRVAGEVGLDTAVAAEVLQSDRYAAEVREREQFFQRHGINSVPAVIINERHLISGGQPAAVFEKALREIMAQP